MLTYLLSANECEHFFGKYISFMKIPSNIVNKVDLEKYTGS